MIKRERTGSFEEPEVKKLKREVRCQDYGLACEIGEKNENQDAVFVSANIFAVFDGHGELGKLASERAKEIAEKSVHQDSIPETKEDAEILIRTLINAIDKDLVQIGKARDIDFGTTATIAVPYGKGTVVGAVIGNVGDSDALVIKNGTECVTLDSLHRVSSEQERIEAEGGRVWRLRVIPKTGYTNDQIRKKHLALTLSRSLGHYILKNYGVIPTPAFKDITLSAGDTLIVASDGIWDALTAETVAKLVSTNNELTLSLLCQKICKESLVSWKKKQMFADNMAIVIAKFI